MSDPSHSPVVHDLMMSAKAHAHYARQSFKAGIKAAVEVGLHPDLEARVDELSARIYRKLAKRFFDIDDCTDRTLRFLEKRWLDALNDICDLGDTALTLKKRERIKARLRRNSMTGYAILCLKDEQNERTES